MALALSGCAIVMPPTQVDAAAPLQWQAPLPHEGTLGGLSRWWQEQGDPVLLSLIESAQSVSPTIAQALARLEAARAQRTSASAALQPRVDANVSAQRGVSQPDVPVASTLGAGLQASWELDLVGANRAVRRAATSQVQGSQAQWHDARVSVAAEVANAYYGLVTCSQLLAVLRQDADSRQASARLTTLNVQAGFAAPEQAALARASAADAASRVTQQQAACDVETKALVALTGVPEADIRQKVPLAPANTAQAAPILIASVPAQTLAQRPDVYAAERDVVLASAQVGSAQAQRYPRLTLNGSVGALRYSSAGRDASMDTWSFGPLALTLPVFDAGQRKAQVVAAQAAYAHSVSLYRAKVRQAVREVEEALVQLHSTQARAQDVALARAGYAESLAATQARYDQGLASLLDLEAARRYALAAQSAHIALALERQRAWVALYRALGGGFVPESQSTSDASTVNPVSASASP